MAVSERDKRYMAKLSEFLKEAESHTPATEEQRKWWMARVNPGRVARGLPPLEDDDDIPELEFFERARERGMLRGGPRSAQRADRSMGVDRRVRGHGAHRKPKTND